MPHFTIQVVHDYEDHGGIKITTFRPYEADHVKKVPEDIRRAIRTLNRKYMDMVVILKHDPSDPIVSVINNGLCQGECVMDFDHVDELEVWLDSKGEKRLEELRRLEMEECDRVDHEKSLVEQRAKTEMERLDAIDTFALARAKLGIKKSKVEIE